MEQILLQARNQRVIFEIESNATATFQLIDVDKLTIARRLSTQSNINILKKQRFFSPIDSEKIYREFR